MYWVQFGISALLIVIAGTRLTKQADVLSEQLNLGRAWVGLLLLGLVTSLPELITSTVSLVHLDAPNLAVGNILGSNNFNPLLLVVMDLVYRQGSVTNAIQPHRSHRVSAYVAMGLTIIVMAEMSFGSRVLMGSLSWGMIVIAIGYIGAMRYLSTLNKPDEKETLNATHAGVSIKKVWIEFIVCALVVVFSAVWLTSAADEIAISTGLGRTFVGSLLLAIVTSLPEMVVTISALRLGSVDLAIGNIFGSNMINIFILSICSLIYTKAPILSIVSRQHILTGCLSLILSVIAIIGISMRRKKSIGGMGVDTLLMLAIFILGNLFIYRNSF